MPGILPMKVIRVGSSAQSRVAQACDRCRSKKIRCDGIRPCCTQCKSVGFECKTSDKLSRRAFPRGYTESLEDRVRGLEAEVRELKQLLDEKDEKIDMLSRIHSFSSAARKNSAAESAANPQDSKSGECAEVEEAFEVVPSNPDASISPPSTSTLSSFIESFKAKATASGRQTQTIKTSSLKAILQPSSSVHSSLPRTTSRAPPRLLSDQYINVFFQEWSPLFPLLDRSKFLQIYQDFLADPEAPQWLHRRHDIAQLYLVFDIACFAVRTSAKQAPTSYEREWRRAMQSMSSTPSLATLQCHIMAQLLYLLKDDERHFLKHRSSGVTICHQLGMQLTQEHLALDIAEKENRKRVFWSQYIVDRFGASTSGVPMLLRDKDISVEIPTDMAEETASTKDESCNQMTTFSALIRVSQVMSKVLDDLHPTATKYKISMQKISSLSEEVDRWVSSLPEHLRLKFANDKPSTGIISDRSPLLSLAEFYIRMLINRPLMCFGSGNNASAAVIASSDLAKHIAQLCDLLEERNMKYTFPVSKSTLLLNAGFSLLWQSLDLSHESKLMKDNQKTLALISRLLYRDSETLAKEFARIMSGVVSGGSASLSATVTAPVARGAQPTNPMPSPESRSRSARKQLQAIAARFSMASLTARPRAENVHRQRPASSSILPQPQFDREQTDSHRFSISSEPAFPALSPTSSCSSNPPQREMNLDYFPLGSDHVATLPDTLNKDHRDHSTWEQLLASIDSGDSNIFNGIYGGSAPSDTFPYHSLDGGPLNVSDIDPSAALSAHASLANPALTAVDSNTNSHPATAGANFVDPLSLWSNNSWPTEAMNSNTLVDLDDIHQAHQAASQNHNPLINIPGSVASSYVSSEEIDSLRSPSGSDDFTSLTGSSGRTMTTSVYSDGSLGPPGTTRKRSSISSGTSGLGISQMHHQHTTAKSSSGAADELLESSAYGGIVIPNEYGIGFS